MALTLTHCTRPERRRHAKFDADAKAERELTVFRLPAASVDDRVNALAESHGADAQPVRGHGVGRLKNALPHLRRIEREFPGDLVDLALEREARSGAYTHRPE